MKAAAALFRFLHDAALRGERTALVTITDVIGSSSRALGTHLAVSETGAFHGSLSGGCVEAAVVAEAQRIITNAQAEMIRFGTGSRFIDIRLPCGGGLDLFFVPGPPIEVLRHVLECLGQRRSVSLYLAPDGQISATPSASADETGWIDRTFLAKHDADLKLMLVGHGEEMVALAGLANTFGAEVCALSPDDFVVQAIADKGLASRRLKMPERSPELVSDARTAVVFVFHDHDWEPDLLVQALEGDAFYVGAMGSRRTHGRRMDALRERGVPEASISRIAAPIGLIPATRDPDTLALSILSQIVKLASEGSAGRCS